MSLKTKHFVIIGIGFIVSAILVGGIFFQQARASTLEASLQLQIDSTKEYRVGQSELITVPILLNTGDSVINGVDLSFTYDSKILRLEGIIPGTGTSLKTLLPQTTAGQFDSASVITQAQTSGRVQFSAVSAELSSSTVNPFKGSTIIATLQFRPVGEGSGSVQWNSVSGRTDDTNVVLSGETPIDILGEATNGQIAVLPGLSPLPTNSPIPTITSTPTNIPLPTSTIVPTSTVVPTLAPSPTSTPKPSSSPTPVSGQEVTVTYSITNGSDDVYQDNSFYTSERELWFGRGQRNPSLLGLRFQNVTIPKNAVIKTAYLELYSIQQSWISVNVTYAFELNANSAAYSSTNMPSKRTLTGSKVNLADNVQWNASSWYKSPNLASSLKQVIALNSWDDSNTINLVVSGRGSTWARKQIASYERGSFQAPRLVVTYSVP